MLMAEGTLSPLAPPHRKGRACSLEKGRHHSQQEKRPSGQEAKAGRPSLSLGVEAKRREDQDAVRAGQVRVHGTGQGLPTPEPGQLGA